MTERPSPAVYRRRRAVLLVAVLAVVALVWWGIAALTAGGGSESAPASTEPAATEAPAEAAPPATTAAPTPTPTGPMPCTDAEVQVTATLDAGEYAPEAQPQLSMTVVNSSQLACTLDIGTATQVYTIASGADTIWVSTDCQTDPVNEVVALQPGQELQAPAISWVRERSTPETCEGERPAAVAGGATYQLTVAIGGLTSEPASFILA